MPSEADILLERLKLLNSYTSDLRQLQSTDLDTYRENKLIHRTVERTLHLAIEACLDIGRHIIANEGFRMAEDNKDVFAVLHDQGILDADQHAALTAMAGFRNLIVHSYAKIDHAIVFGILTQRLGDFDRFAQTIARYLDDG